MITVSGGDDPPDALTVSTRNRLPSARSRQRSYGAAPASHPTAETARDWRTI